MALSAKYEFIFKKSLVLLVWAIKILRLTTISFRVFQGLLRTSFLSIWVFLELRTIRFLFYLFCRKKNIITKERLKLFLIQALSGLLILILILQKEFFRRKLVRVFIRLIIIFKIRAAPFHGWLLSFINEIVWDVIFIFLTLIKFIPLIILRRLNLKSLEIFTVLSFLVAAIRRVYLTNLKKLSLISSVFFLGIIYSLIKTSVFWVELLVTYRVIFGGIVLYFLRSNEILRRRQIHPSGRIIRVIGFIILINIAGLPPLPGFFLKLIWLLQANISLISILIFIRASRLIIFIYLSFSLKILREINSEFLINFQINFTRFIFMIIVRTLMATPLLKIF